MQMELSVRGMHCVSCKHLIEEDLSELPGVRSISVDLNGARASVDFDETKLSPQILIDKIAELGYQAEKIAGA